MCAVCCPGPARTCHVSLAYVLKEWLVVFDTYYYQYTHIYIQARQLAWRLVVPEEVGWPMMGRSGSGPLMIDFQLFSKHCDCDCMYDMLYASPHRVPPPQHSSRHDLQPTTHSTHSRLTRTVYAHPFRRVYYSQNETQVINKKKLVKCCL